MAEETLGTRGLQILSSGLTWLAMESSNPDLEVRFATEAQHPKQPRGRIFLLSPANVSGKRGQLLLGKHARGELATRLREASLPLGEVFSFISGLYFRGKLAYARAFAEPPRSAAGVMIITASRGLIRPETPVSLQKLRTMVANPIDERDACYRRPLERDARLLLRQIGCCEVVLLGSIATAKYIEPLLGIFGTRLVFPVEFAGRGDMSRGGLMLRAARNGTPLTYAPVATSCLHGPRPAKLVKLPSLRGKAAAATIERISASKIAGKNCFHSDSWFCETLRAKIVARCSSSRLVW